MPVGFFIRVDALLGETEAENGVVEQKVRMVYVTFRFQPYSFLEYSRFALAFVFTCSLFVAAVLSDKFKLSPNSLVPYKRSLFVADIDTAASKSNRYYDTKCKSPADSSDRYPLNRFEYCLIVRLILQCSRFLHLNCFGYFDVLFPVRTESIIPSTRAICALSSAVKDLLSLKFPRYALAFCSSRSSINLLVSRNTSDKLPLSGKVPDAVAPCLEYIFSFAASNLLCDFASTMFA